MAAASIKDVASLAGVSVGTVSNVLNRPDVVTETTRHKVEQAIAMLGFVRNESARALRAGRSRTVGMLVLDVSNPFFTDVARGVEDVVTANGAVLGLFNSGEDASRESTHLRHLMEQRVQGVLVTPVDSGTPGLQRLVAAGTPVVLVDRGGRASDQCSVSVDDVHGGRLAVDHLLDQGHLRLAFIGGPLSIQQVADRYRGAVSAVEASDTDASLRLVETPGLSVAAGREAGTTLAALPATRRPNGVFCANDLVALGVLQAMTMAGLGVPDDVAIIGYDDIDYAAAAAVPLSSVRQPREQLGRAAAELLFDEISRGEAHEHQQVVFEPELVARASTVRLRRRTRKVG